MPEARPAPYPADTRAKGWRFELEYERIEQSDTWAIAEEVQMAQHALLFMWLAAWRQVPCGSLPADETMIRAKCRIPPKLWAGLRDVLMRGWWLADDGRLYHDTIAERVQQMLDSRGVDRTRQDARQKMLEKVRERDGRACVYCAHTKYLTLDHLLPISRGGDNDERNLAMACRPCNSKKGARTPDEAGMTLENKTAMARWLDYMADRADPQKTKVIGVSPLEKSGEVERDDTGTGTTKDNTHTTLAPEWVLPKAWGEWAIAEYPHWTPETVRSIAQQFADHQWSKAATSADWMATWRKWCRDDLTQRAHPVPKPKAVDKPVQGAPAITVPSTDKGAERFQAAMDERAATATKPPAAVLALAGKAVRTA